MSWIAVLLLGVAVTDLVRSARPLPLLPEATGAAVALFAGLACDLTRPVDLVVLLGIVAVVVAWGQGVTRSTRDDAPVGAWLPLTVLGAALVVLGVCSIWAQPAAGVVGTWLERSDVPVLTGMDATDALVLVAVLLVQLATGNVVVRLVLLATGTVDPSVSAPGAPVEQPSDQLRGGRLLGPMERVLIVGLGVAGHVTAASIVIAAKGLLRFPELQAKRDLARPAGTERMIPTNIDKVTEYFLVGSFLSWMVALGSLVLLSGH